MIQTRNRRLRDSRRTGYTLIEMTVSLLISSILLMGMGTSIWMATQANNVQLGPFHASNQSSDAFARLSRELRYAKTINDAINLPTMVEFTIADINGDTIDETIRYEWSGIPGAPLERTFNANPPEVVVADIRNFNLIYETDTVAATGGGFTESAEQQFIDVQGGSGSGEDVTSSNWCGSHFTVSLPAEATSWNITRAQLLVTGKNPKDGVVSMQVRLADPGGVPGTGIVDQKLIFENNELRSMRLHG